MKILLNKLKSKNPKNLDELRQISIEEWNKISKRHYSEIIQKFHKKCNKIIELIG